MSRTVIPAHLPLDYEAAFARPENPAIADRFLAMLAIVLMGYALFGRAFAYVGVPPIFIGEITVLVGLFTLLTTPRWTRMFRTSQAVILIPFIIWVRQ